MRYRLGELLRAEDERNTEGRYTLDDVRGISTQKIFTDTKADMAGVSLRPYIIVKPGAFAYVPDTSRRGDKISLAYNNTESTYLVSSISVVFSVKRPDLLIPEYLFMYFSRPEFDRYARFHSWGSARENFSFDDMCSVQIPIPPLDVQRSIANIYTAMNARKRITDRLKALIRQACPVLINQGRSR